MRKRDFNLESPIILILTFLIIKLIRIEYNSYWLLLNFKKKFSLFSQKKEIEKSLKFRACLNLNPRNEKLWSLKFIHSKKKKNKQYKENERVNEV